MLTKSHTIEKGQSDEPFHALSHTITIGPASRLIGVCVDTLRIWEKKGLIKPQRMGNKRIYSSQDVERLKKIHLLVHFQKVNIEGVRIILNISERQKLQDPRNNKNKESRKQKPAQA